MIDQLVSLVRTLTISQRIGIVFGALFSVLLLVGLVMWAGQPQMVVAFGGLDMQSASTVTAALDGAGIEYDLADGGATIKVAAADAARAKIAASDAGYTADGSSTGFGMFDQQGFGATEFDQQVKYQRALQGDLTGKIKSIRGVSDASVTIVPAKTGTLASNDQPASASVWIKMAGGGQPSGDQVTGIVALVSGAVAKLSPDNVTVVDANGTTLHGPSTAAGDAVTIKATIERDIANKVTALLNATLGAGHSQVAVSADVDLQKITEQVTRIEQGAPTSAQDSVELQGQDAAAAAGGIAGTASNVAGITYPNASASPDPSASAAPSASIGPDTYVKHTTTVNWANTQTVQQIISMPGTVKRVSVAVLLDQAALQAQGVDSASLTNAIAATAGIASLQLDDKGGCVADANCLQVQPVAFYDPAKDATAVAAESAGIMETVGGVLPQVGGGLALAALLFLAWRNMRALGRRAEEMQLSAARMPMAALGAGDMSFAALGAGGYGEIPEAPAPPSAQQRALEHIQNVAGQNPEPVARMARAWLNEDENRRRR